MAKLRLGLFVAAAFCAVTAVDAVAADLAGASVASLLREADGADPAARLAATRELFRRGPAIGARLACAGAKPMATIDPARGDVIYSLLTGKLGSAEAAPATFGLHLEGGVTENEVEAMGRAHGFRLIPTAACGSQQSPTCYVQLLPGKRLADVLREVLTTEPRVKTVNLNYVER